MIGSKIIHLESVDSTNNYVANLIKAKNIVNGTVILADVQSAGKGQRGSNWYTEPGLNLTTSIYMDSVNLSVKDQFYLSKWVAIVLIELLNKNGINAQIKWPNDIYVNNRKIAGVLIESQLSDLKIKSTIIGIGLNVNQKDFENLNATSIIHEIGEFKSINEVLFSLIASLNSSIDLLLNQEFSLIDEKYHSYLLGKDEKRSFLLKDKEIEGVILSVNDSGYLEIMISKEVRKFDIKEIQFKF
jgi:BirA family biotin operon repressor/biotin-[acetyl-CoA-carboxylase] ligase